MRRLTGAHEHLDGPLEAGTLAGNLRDLERLNRWSGGVSLTRRALEALVGGPEQGPGHDPRAPLHILDVGTGAGDIPAALLRTRRAAGLTVTAVDSRPEIVAAARSRRGDVPGLTLQVADGAALPFPDAHFDVAHASLVLHHLEPGDAARLLHEMARVARLGVVINDLDRTPLGWLGAWLLVHATTRNRYTRHDAPLSVRRAYRPAEVAALATRHGLHEVRRFATPAGVRYSIAFGGSAPGGA